MNKRSWYEIAFDGLNVLLLGLLAFSMLFPFLNVFAKSLSSSTAVLTGSVILWPKDIQLDAYRYVMEQGQFINSFKISLFITLAGTAAGMLVTVMTAYPLSKPGLRGRRAFMLLFIFVMLFSGGMIPNYLLMKTLGLLNTVGALVFPGMLSVFNMIIVKTFFEELPESVEESAKLDGASNMVILFTIILPMSLPVLASVSLFYAVGYWNSYFSAVMYITKPSLKPLQQYLYDLITQSVDGGQSGGADIDRLMNMTPDTIRCTTIILSTIPILCVYPFLQKYFVKGLTIGSVKG